MLGCTGRGAVRTARGVVFCAAAILLAVGPALVEGQVSPEEHASHHPEQSIPEAPASQSDVGQNVPAVVTSEPDAKAANGEGGMMGGGMGKMMEQMGAPKPKQLYPSLMALPDLPLERRQEVQQQAHDRMKAGAALMSEGLEALSRAAPSDDYMAMQDATAIVQEGLSQFDSGLAAHRALAEGKAPRNVALQWFKREMNLLPPGGGEVRPGLLGLSWFHFFVMLILVLFAAAMIAMYFFKMRRAASLLANIAKHKAAEPSAETPKSAKTDVKQPAAEKNPAPPPSPSTVPDSTAGPAPTAASDCCADEGEGGPCAGEESPGAGGVSGGLLPLAKKKLCRLRVARIDQETPDVKTFRLVACHGGGIPFSYLPGQFLTLTLPVGEKPIRRSYTISSSPTQGYHCEITVKREEQGAGSRYLHDRVKVGDTLEVKAPSGKFVFTGKEADGIVLIAGGVGITPMMSITRALTDMAWTGEIFFIVACQDPEHFIFESELTRLAARHDNLHLFAAMSRIETDMEGYRRGRLSKEMLAGWVPDLGSKWIHLCGAPPMMDTVKQMLSELDVPVDRIHTENFGSTQKPKVQVAPRQEAVADNKQSPQNGTVAFTTSDISTELLPDETVLEASERVGVDIDYSCRVGTCGECKVKLLSGEVTMEVEDGLDPGEKDQGIILACQAKSTGGVSVDA